MSINNLPFDCKMFVHCMLCSFTGNFYILYYKRVHMFLLQRHGHRIQTDLFWFESSSWTNKISVCPRWQKIWGQADLNGGLARDKTEYVCPSSRCAQRQCRPISVPLNTHSDLPIVTTHMGKHSHTVPCACATIFYFKGVMTRSIVDALLELCSPLFIAAIASGLFPQTEYRSLE